MLLQALMTWATNFTIMSDYVPYQTEEQKELSRRGATPPSVKNALYSKWWLEPAWRQMHYSNSGNNLGVCVGGNGTGKSWLLLWVAEKLGVDKGGRPRLFDPDHLEKHVCFDALTFSDIVKDLMDKPRKQTIGYQIILDEGQLALYSKEALTQEVKNLSRLLMTVRSRRWGVYINLPSFKMLNKDVRTITNWLVWMKGKPTDVSYGTYYNVENNMMGGESYLKKPVFTKNIVLKKGMVMNVRVANNILSFPKPSKHITDAYEQMKEDHQKALYERFNLEMHASVDKAEKDTSKDDTKQVEEITQKLLADHKKFWTERYGFSARKIAAVFGVSYELASKAKYLAEDQL